MRYFKFSKLVRDKIIDSMKSNQQDLRGVKELNDKEYLIELKNKLLEETKEIISTTQNNDLKEEIADVQEVLDYLKKELKMNEVEINSYKNKKIKKHGGFDKRLFIEDVGVDEGNKWFLYFKNNPEKYPEIV